MNYSYLEIFFSSTIFKIFLKPNVGFLNFSKQISNKNELIRKIHILLEINHLEINFSNFVIVERERVCGKHCTPLGTLSTQIPMLSAASLETSQSRCNLLLRGTAWPFFEGSLLPARSTEHTSIAFVRVR